MKFSFFFFSAMPIADAISEHWDSPPLFIAKLATIGALVALNGFFVAAEFALVKVRRSQVDTLATEGNRRAAAGKHVIENLNAYLSACQLGITLASLGLGWLGEPLFAHLLEPLFALLNITSPQIIEVIAFFVAFSLLSFLHIVVGELMPKSLAIRQSEQISLWTA